MKNYIFPLDLTCHAVEQILVFQSTLDEDLKMLKKLNIDIKIREILMVYSECCLESKYVKMYRALHLKFESCSHFQVNRLSGR